MPAPKTPKSRKAPPTTAVRIGKKGRRRSSTISTSTFDFSSSLSSADDNYSAVDDISDDEDDDEEDVTAVEERAMVGETISSPGATRSLFDDDGSDNDGDDDDDSNDEDDEDDDEDDEGGAGLVPSSDESWGGLSPAHQEEIQEEEDEFKWPIRKKSVRWASEEEDSSDDNDGTLEDFFPDIFVPQSALDRNFRRQVEDEETSGSEYTDLDYEQYEEVMFQKTADRTAPRTPKQELQPAFEPTTCETIPENEEFIEGYNYNDDGSTTEEEDFEVRSRATAAVFHDPSDDDSSEDDQPARRSKGEPLSSRFNLHKFRKKPIALYNHDTKRMMIFTPERHHELGRIPHNPNLQPMLAESPIEVNMDFQQFPPNLFNDSAATNDAQIYEQYFTMPMSELETDNNSYNDLGSSDFDGQEGDGFAFESYINLSESSSDEEGEGQDSTTPSRPVTAHSDSNLSHINSRNVGAFRQNQTNAQLMGSGATRDSIAFSGPLNSTTIRGIKSDRFDTAAAPLTPARRHKRQSSDMMRSPLDAVSQKRKASGETESFNSHKKQKSISSDVAGLQL